jgi:uncharacterized protein with beta-barrel porin domain
LRANLFPGDTMKNLLLGSTTLVALSLVAGMANAACTTTTPTAGQSVDCTGTSTTSVVAGANQDNVTITLENGAHLNTAPTAISINNDSTIHLLGSGTIYATGVLASGINAVGHDNKIDLNDTSYLHTKGDHGYGIYARHGDNNIITLNGQAKILTIGNDAYGVEFDKSNSSRLTLNDDSNIRTTGLQANGVMLRAHNVTVELNGNAYIRTGGNTSSGIATNDSYNTAILNGDTLILTQGNNAFGIQFGDKGYNNVILNGTSYIRTVGNDSAGVLIDHDSAITLNDASKIATAGTRAYGVWIDGNNNNVTLNGGSRITTTGNANAGDGSDGIRAFGDQESINLNGTSSVITSGTGSFAIDLRGIGVGGANRVTMTDRAGVSTSGDGSHAIYSKGAGTIITMSGSDNSVKTTGANADGIKIRSTGADKIVISGDSEIFTLGLMSDGIDLTGNNNEISFNDEASIVTSDQQADGIHLVGDSETVTLNGGSGIITGGQQATGIYVKGNDSAVTLNDQAAVRGVAATDIGIYLFGDRNAAILNGGSIETTGDAIRLIGDHNMASLHKDASVFISGAADGIDATGNFNDVVIDGTATISSNRTDAVGIIFTGNNNSLSMSGDSGITMSGLNGMGVFAHGDGNIISLDGSAHIDTSGTGAHGVYLNGNNNGLILGAGSSIGTTGANANAVRLKGSGNQFANSGSLSSSNAVAILGDSGAADTVANFGKISSGSGTAIDLQGGDDLLALGTGSQITGISDGGAGNDTLLLVGTGREDDVFTNFETLVVNQLYISGQPDWSLTGNSTFTTKIDIVDGRLGVNGTLTSPVTTVHDTGILSGNGTLVSNVTSTGHIAAGNSVGTLTINGNLAQTGGAFDVETDSSGVDRVNVLGAGGVTLAGGVALNILPVNGNTGGAGIILHAPNGITGTFGTVKFVGNGAVDITQTATDISLIAVDGTPAISGDFAASEAGLDFLDSIGDEQIAGLAHCGSDQCARLDDSQKHLWMKAFGHFGNEAARGGDRAFNYTIAGTAMGGDMHVTKDLSLGVSAGYSNTDETVSQHAATADINTGQLGLYANWQHGPFFVTGLLSGGWQSLDLSRNVGGGEADASTTGWLFGSSLQAGAQFSFPKGWRLTPSAGIAYQHQWIEGYSEHGAGAADVSIRGHQADALRLKAQLELANDIELTGYTLTPHLTIGVQQQENLGGHATGAFSNGDGFTLNLKNDSRTIGTIGLGMEVGFQNGLSTYVNYDAALASGRTVQAVTGGLRYSW